MRKLQITGAQLRAFRRFLEDEERERGTVEKYMRDAGAFAVWLGSRALSKEEAAGWKAGLRERGLQPETVNSKLAALNKLLTFLRRPECRVKYLKIQRRLFRGPERELTRSEYRRLLEAAWSAGRARLALLIETICATGIRVSELKFITAEAVRTGRAEIVNKGKRRPLFLPDKLRRLLKKYLQKQKVTAGAVFVTRTGKPVDRSNIWRDMKALCESAGVEPGKVFPHNLRHLFARTYYSLEKDLSRLADILGHSNVSTTRIYTAESGLVHAQQVERLDLILTT